MTKRFQLKGDSLAELTERVAAEYGLTARIVAAERITQGGIGGFLAKHFFEVTVELPTVPAAPTTSAVAGALALPNRVGIAALLAEADEAEDRIHRMSLSAARSVQFDAVFSELSARVGTEDETDVEADTEAQANLPAAVAAREHPIARRAQGTGRPLPVLRNGLGDLILLVGLRTDALRVAHSMSGRLGTSAVSVGGAIKLRSMAAVDGRRSALQVRAEAVEQSRCVFVAYGIEPEADWVSVISEIGADQVWVVVDAGRKHEDTRAWVASVAAAIGVDAVAALGLTTTSTPETVYSLDAPVAWADGRLLAG